jgi:hypothetical protein
MDRYGSTKMAKNFLPSKTTNSELRYYPKELMIFKGESSNLLL